jgi:hypothetical protein
MTNRAKGWTFSLMVSLALWLAIGFGAVQVARGAEVTVQTILSDSHYWPPGCGNGVCILRGNGGIVRMWIAYVDEHPTATFRVEGICASACDLAYIHAESLGRSVEVAPGAKLIYHAPSPARWR